MERTAGQAGMACESNGVSSRKQEPLKARASRDPWVVPALAGGYAEPREDLHNKAAHKGDPQGWHANVRTEFVSVPL